MSDVIDRAKQLLSDAQWCRACKVEQPPFPAVLLGDLVAEVERLRHLERAVQDELTEITDDHVYDRLAAAVGLREQTGT